MGLIIAGHRVEYRNVSYGIVRLRLVLSCVTRSDRFSVLQAHGCLNNSAASIRDLEAVMDSGESSFCALLFHRADLPMHWAVRHTRRIEFRVSVAEAFHHAALPSSTCTLSSVVIASARAAMRSRAAAMRFSPSVSMMRCRWASACSGDMLAVSRRN